ncbi:MAG: XdhC family protein, partial [Woeseia sp.]
MNIRQLLTAFDQWREQQRPLVLATVYETAGSTYSKAGAQMLIDDEGNFQGMLSGGCLEGDLAERAAAVLSTGRAQAVTFDLGSNDDSLWGLGVGCDGLMRVFLQPLLEAQRYEPFAATAQIYSGASRGALATVIRSEHPAVAAGATLLRAPDDGLQANGMPPALTDVLAPILARAMANGETAMLRDGWDGQDVDVLIASIAPTPRILILGGGLDAQPMVRLIAELGWRVTVQDHRPAYIENGDFRDAEQAFSVPASTLATAIDLQQFDAAVIMSHHLVTDRIYLDLLADTGIPYIGLLGPPARRQRLMVELKERGAALQDRVHGPAGLDIGGRGPASIA